MRMVSGVEPAHYQIKIQGVLDAPRWADYFDGLTLASHDGLTTLSGPIVDQAALHGMLTRIRDLGLPLLLVQQIEVAEHSPQEVQQ